MKSFGLYFSCFEHLIGSFHSHLYCIWKKKDSSRNGSFHVTESKTWRRLVSTTLAAAVIAFGMNMSALAELNKFEAETRGEFGIGSAAQFGSADLRFVCEGR